MIQEGVDLIKHFEGFSPVPYKCPGGVWTIGYGTTRYPNGVKVTQYDDECSENVASIWLMYEISRCDYYVLLYCDIGLNKYQYAALGSFVYNLGVGAFKASTLRRRINAEEFNDVPYQISKWNKAGGRVSRGLVRRRKAEIELWETV